MSEVIVRPEPRRPLLLRVLGWPVAVLLILGTVVAGEQIIKHTPGSEEVTRPFVHSGGIGEPVDGLDFTAIVRSVRGGTAIVDRGQPLTTDGVFVVVKVNITARTDTTRLLHLALVGGGRTYDSTERITQDMRTQAYQPGLPVEGEIAFEVPKTGATGLALQLSAKTVVGSNNQSVAQFRLDIDQSKVETWLANRSPIELDQPKVQP